MRFRKAVNFSGKGQHRVLERLDESGVERGDLKWSRLLAFHVHAENSRIGVHRHRKLLPKLILKAHRFLPPIMYDHLITAYTRKGYLPDIPVVLVPLAEWQEARGPRRVTVAVRCRPRLRRLAFWALAGLRLRPYDRASALRFMDPDSEGAKVMRAALGADDGR